MKATFSSIFTVSPIGMFGFQYPTVHMYIWYYFHLSVYLLFVEVLNATDLC